MDTNIKVIEWKEFQQRFGSTDEQIRNLFNFFGKDIKKRHHIGEDDGTPLYIKFNGYA